MIPSPTAGTLTVPAAGGVAHLGQAEQSVSIFRNADSFRGAPGRPHTFALPLWPSLPPLAE